MLKPLLTAAVAGCLVLLAGCGNSRTPVPNIDRPAPPAGFRKLTIGSAGISLITPRNWTVSNQTAPLVLTVNSGPAVVALWRLPRSAAPPAGRAGVAATRRALLAAVRRRDRTVAELHAASTRVDGAPAIRLDARERIAGQLRQVTSTHVYVNGAELVLDEYAPPGQFASVARSVFSPVRRSLTLVPVIPAGP
ncbi:MAG TPA: hypothetical protein VHW04_06840 [Solirubrobacteraceae bacterium]|nr:hypothetical protein [Solirubrobacteraceae bacterium]